MALDENKAEDRDEMTKTKALDLIKSYGPGWCIVRYATRYGNPSWRIETAWRAQQQLREYGSTEIAVEVET